MRSYLNIFGSMRVLFLNYASVPEYTDPALWLERISFYAGILEALALQHEVHSVERICWKGKLERNGVHYHFMGAGRRYGLRNLLHRHPPGAVVVHGLLFPLQVMRLRQRLPRFVPIFLHHHAERPFSGWKRKLQQLADRSVDRYFFAARAIAEDWQKARIISNLDKVVVEGSSAFLPVYRTTARQTTGVEGNPAILWVGRLQANKDPLTGVEGCLRFFEIHPEGRLYMIFQTEELKAAILAQLAGHPNAAAVTLVGKVAHKELAAWYSAADWYLSCSHYEGSGIAPCEAMSCGCVPVLSDIAPYRMLTAGGTVGGLFAPGSAAALWQCLEAVMQKNRETERTAVLRQFRERLSFEAIAARMSAAFTALKQSHA